MGGEHSPMFEYFKSLLIRGLFEVRKHMDELIVLIQIMGDVPSVIDSDGNTTKSGSNCSMPCIKNIVSLEQEVRDRISGKFNVGSQKGNEFQELVERIVHQSLNNSTTKMYDFFQKNSNGIEP